MLFLECSLDLLDVLNDAYIGCGLGIKSPGGGRELMIKS